MLDKLAKDGIPIQPVFITCDPARDTPEVLDAYLKDFHPGIIGLTGTFEQVKNTCKNSECIFNTTGCQTRSRLLGRPSDFLLFD